MTRKSTTLLLASFVLLAALTPAGTGVAAADDFVSVSVDAPAFPTPDQPFPVAVSVTNAESSNTAYDVLGVEVRRGESATSKRIAGRFTGVTQVAPGETARRSVEVTLNKTKTHELYVHVVLSRDNGDRRRVVHPLTLDVDGEHPQLSLTTQSALPGEARELTVNVSNGRDDAIRQLKVSVDGEAVSVDERSKIRARLDGGARASFSFTAKAAESGRHPVGVSLAYTTADGERREVRRILGADFTPPEPPADRPQLAVETESAVVGAWRSLNVTISNGMDSPVRQVALEAASDAVVIEKSRHVTPSVAAQSAKTFAFRAKADEAGNYPVNVTLTYTDSDGVKRQLSRTIDADFTAPDNPGRISLTGVSAERRGDVLAISGSAANLGGEAVDSVLVSVAEEQNVEKAQPQPEYFVGTVEASDFVTFDVNARLRNNRTTVPLKVTYVVDGMTMTETITVDVGAAAEPPKPKKSGGSPPFAFLGFLSVALMGAGVFWWRRR